MFLNYFHATQSMVIQTARGIVRSVKIFDDNRKAEIILRINVNPIVDITLKISNDNDSAYLAMITVVCSSINFGDASFPGQAPNLHVTYNDSDMEIDELEFHWH